MAFSAGSGPQADRAADGPPGAGHNQLMDLAAKLQLRPDQGLSPIGLPGTGMAALDGITRDDGPTAAVLVFAADRAELDDRRAVVVDAAAADRLTWVAYPKAGQLGTDLNRDSLAAALGTEGIRPVRQVSIDDVWSALRFRPQ